jgi:hypothetical protein
VECSHNGTDGTLSNILFTFPRQLPAIMRVQYSKQKNMAELNDWCSMGLLALGCVSSERSRITG